MELSSKQKVPIFRTNVDWVLFALYVASLIISASLILQDSGVVPAFPMDQAFVQAADVSIGKVDGKWFFHYPALQNGSGITAYLIAGIYKLLIPTDPSNLNWHFRILSMVMYLTSSLLLVRSFIEDYWFRILIFIVVATSGYQFIQPSSEIIAGSLLALTFVALRKSWPKALAAFFLAGFGLCKVELGFGALAMAIAWSIWSSEKADSRNWRFLLYTAGWMAFFLAPGFVLEGASPLGGNRSYLAFIFNYAEVFGPHQFNGYVSTDGEKTVDLIRTNIFGTSKSVLEIISKHPLLYADFFGIQSVRGILGTAQGLKLTLLPALLVIAKQRCLGFIRPYVIAALIVTLVSLAPAMLLAFIRLRYWVKLFPIVIVLAASGCLILSTNYKRYKLILLCCCIGTVAWQLLTLPGILKFSHWY